MLLPISTTNTFTNIASTHKCFAWWVVAICKDGTISRESDIACSCNKIRLREELEETYSGANEVLVAPNPTKEPVTFNLLTEENLTAPVQLDIYNITGQRVIQTSLTANQAQQLDVSHLPVGTYIYHVRLNDSEYLTGKLFVE